MTPNRSPYETLRDEADAIGQRARAAAVFAGQQVDLSTAYLFVLIAQRADEAVRQIRLKIRELEKAAGEETQ